MCESTVAICSTRAVHELIVFRALEFWAEDPDQDSNHPKRVLSSVHTRQAPCLSHCLSDKNIKHVRHWVSCFYWRRRRKVCKAGPVMFEETLFQWAAGSHRYKELQFHMDRLGSLCWSQRDQSGQGPATWQADARYLSILLYGTWSFPVMPSPAQFCQTIQSDGSGCVFLRARCSDVAVCRFCPDGGAGSFCKIAVTQTWTQLWSVVTMCQGVVDSARRWARGCFPHVPQVRQAHAVPCLHSETGSPCIIMYCICVLYCYFPWTPATRAFEVGSSFLWYEDCREHRGVQIRKSETKSSRFQHF